MTNFLKELSKNKEYFCMAVIILLLVYLFCNTCNKENLVIKGSSNTNMSQVLGLNSNNEIVLSENLSTFGSTVPIGTILMWSPKYAASPNINKPLTKIPTGWLQCDGSTTRINNIPYSTPDLTNKFIKGASIQNQNADVGTTPPKKVLLQTTDLPQHEHYGLPSADCYGTGCPLNKVKVNSGSGYVYNDGTTLGIKNYYTKPGYTAPTTNPKPVEKNQTPINIPEPDNYTLVYIIKVY